MAAVYEGGRLALDRVLGPVERLTYRRCGVRRHDDGTPEEMRWTTYVATVLLFTLLGALAVYALQRLQSPRPPEWRCWWRCFADFGGPGRRRSATSGSTSSAGRSTSYRRCRLSWRWCWRCSRCLSPRPSSRSAPRWPSARACADQPRPPRLQPGALLVQLDGKQQRKRLRRPRRGFLDRCQELISSAELAESIKHLFPEQPLSGRHRPV